MSRILVADDDLAQLELRKMVLEAAGHSVSVAYSTEHTVRSLQDDGADLVIMDLRFPNASGEADAREGLELIRSIRVVAHGTPVVVLSGWPADLDDQPELRMVDRVLLKPVKTAVLIETIRELIS